MILTFLDLLYHALGVLLADIVDDDVGTETTEHESISSTETGTSTGDDDGLALVVNGRIGLRVAREGPRPLKEGLKETWRGRSTLMECVRIKTKG
jgi:hypothetical protein